MFRTFFPVRAGEIERERDGDWSPGPQKFHLLGGAEGNPVFLKCPFRLTLCYFLGSLLFLHTLCGPFWRLGPFSVRAPKAWSPTSELISPGLSLVGRT